MRAAKGLAKRRWNTAEAMLGSTWKQRVDVLNAAGYTRYQERTSTMRAPQARRRRPPSRRRGPTRGIS
ncbi:MAG TPA: hypothetical protein VHG90_04965 [Acidimicrobiales bacterium]|nr:hypothetical protein [Acidimicrobiales bacterium]